MELPEKFLNNLASHIYMLEFEHADDAKKLAKGIGDSLELFGKEESRYIIEHSYEALFRNYNKHIEASESLWNEWVVIGMGDHHKDLQEELSDLTANKVNNKLNNKHLER